MESGTGSKNWADSYSVRDPAGAEAPVIWVQEVMWSILNYYYNYHI